MGNNKMQTWASEPRDHPIRRLALIAILVLGIGIAVAFYLRKGAEPIQSSNPPVQANRPAVEMLETPRLPASQLNIAPVAKEPGALLPPTEWVEDFGSGSLNPAKWVVISQNDFKEKTVDIVKSGETHRLRMRAGTIETDDQTVKYLGVRSIEGFALQPGTTISVDLDWNNQANGSYLSAGIILCPSVTAGNPLDEPDWLKVEYFGVPPGKNGRVVIGQCAGGREEQLYTEDWPEVRREGRAIGRQHVEIAAGQSEFTFLENGKQIFAFKAASSWPSAAGRKAHIYLQMSSHSNYPPRELFFERVTVEYNGTGVK